MKTSNKTATLVFRVLVGCFATLLLGVLIYSNAYPKKLGSMIAMPAFFGLLFGYAFGGDRWGAKLFTLFTGKRVLEEKAPEPSPEPEEERKFIRPEKEWPRKRL